MIFAEKKKKMANYKKRGKEDFHEAMGRFRSEVHELKSKGFVYFSIPTVGEVPTSSEKMDMAIFGTSVPSGDVFDCKQSTPSLIGGIGSDGLGYIPWGPLNMLPNTIYSLAGALPYTSAAIKYLIDLTVGYGPTLMYKWVRYVGGSVTAELIPFESAGKVIRGRILELSKGISDDLSQTYINAIKDEIVSLEEDYMEWKKSNVEISKFLEDNNLNLHFLECMTDDVHMDIYFPTIGLSVGRPSEEWNPKIVKVGFIPSVCARMEEMDDSYRVNYVYYSERWRLDSTAKLDAKQVVAYHALMPDEMLRTLKSVVNEHRKTKSLKRRPTWFCCPNYYPSVQKPYYPQPAWWSIFTSRVYDYASRLITDKAIARQNATMWGKIIMINLEYLKEIYNQMGADTDDEKNKIRSEIEKRINDFLRRRENNGKTIMLDSFISPADGKTLMDSIRILDVPQPTNAVELKTELEEIGSIISFSLGVNASLVGSVPGRTGGSGGTFQRELHLLKQSQVSPRQRIYLRFLQNIHSFNGWDKHGVWVVRMPVLTTLDRSATGLDETTSDG